MYLLYNGILYVFFLLSGILYVMGHLNLQIVIAVLELSNVPAIITKIIVILQNFKLKKFTFLDLD